MDYYCDVCDKLIKPKSKYKHFKLNTHKEFDKCKHMKLTIENLDIDDIDEVFHAYIIHHKKIRSFPYQMHFELVFNDNQYSTWSKSNLFNNKTMISWKKYLENVIDDFKDEGYNFNHIEKMNIITISNKMDMTYDFYNKHFMHAVERKSNAMVNKNKSLINKFNETCRHPLNRKFRNNRI